MKVLLNSSPYRTLSTRGQMQVGIAGIATIVKVLNMGDLDPLAAGLSIQAVMRILKLYQERFPKPSSEIAQYIASDIVFCASYTLASQITPSLQVISFLALLILEVKKGVRGIEPEVFNSTLQTPSQIAAAIMRLQIGHSCAALAATLLKIANLNPIALGLAANYLVLGDFPFIKQLPTISQVFLSGGMACAAYVLTSQLDPKLQVICYVALLVFNVELIRPKNVWKELKV